MPQGRQEEEFKLIQPDGTTKIYTIVPFVTADDLMLLSMQAVAGEIKYGIPYATPSPREARDQLLLLRVTNRS
jgi:hypothetical protein